MRMKMFDPRFYPEVAFGGFPRMDGVIQYYSRINSLIAPDSIVVDFGCGRGQHADDPIPFRRALRNLRGKVAKVIGLDVDIAAKDNPTIDEFKLLAPGSKWPLENDSVDLAICDYVLEHLPDPDIFFLEARRTLRVGGILCLATTNLFSYVGLATKLIPNRFHSRIVTSVLEGRKAQDVFPTLHRCNTIRAVRREMLKNGFETAIYGFDGGPGYLTFSKIAYSLGYLHQQIAPSFIRPIIVAFGRKLS
jgi:SAM-dependent methyltransferase